MSYLSDKIERVLATLQEQQTRCTYGALADYVGVHPRHVSALLSPKRPEASWIVSKATGLPTGYEDYQRHPELAANEQIISDVADLKALVAERRAV